MNLRVPAISGTGGRPLTGRAVLVMLVVFFGLIVVVNVAMVRAAISTFGGVDTPSSYQAGLTFKAEEAAAEAQNERGWKVGATLTSAGGLVTAAIAVHDAAGAAVTGAEIVAHLAHPVDERRDVALTVTETGNGTYRATGEAEPGQWILDLDILEDGTRLFQSYNRVMIAPARP